MTRSRSTRYKVNSLFTIHMVECVLKSEYFKGCI